MNRLEETIILLSKLVSFPSVRDWPNSEMIAWLADHVRPFADHVQVVDGCDCANSGLIIRVGSGQAGDVVLSGHLDVVPAAPGGPDNPWNLSQRQGRLFGRGAADMKGFIACCLTMLRAWSANDHHRPFYLVLSHNEETGSQCTPHLIAALRKLTDAPALVVVGEPTGLEIVCGHKATYGAVTTITGRAAHSSDPEKGCDANLAAASLIKWMQRQQCEARSSSEPGTKFTPAFTTCNAGVITGGQARNVVSDHVEIGWECRLMPSDDPDAFLSAFEHYCRTQMAEDAGRAAGSFVSRTERISFMPALDPSLHVEAVGAVRDGLGLGPAQIVPFATEAGFFQREGWPSLVFGPGHIDQAHKPDEFIEIDQLQRCLELLDRLADLQFPAIVREAVGG